MDCGKQLIKIQGMVISVKLSYKGVFEHKQDWQKAGFELPSYDLQQVKEETIRNPVWVHFGAGNIFRAFQANARLQHTARPLPSFFLKIRKKLLTMGNYYDIILISGGDKL